MVGPERVLRRLRRTDELLAIQACIDTGAHLVAELGLPTPDDYRRRSNVDLATDRWSGEILVFEFDFDEALNAEVKRLPGRRFDWRRRVWTVPVQPGLAERVSAILARCPWLRLSPGVSGWLAGERRFAAEVTVVEMEGPEGRFALWPFSG